MDNLKRCVWGCFGKSFFLFGKHYFFNLTNETEMSFHSADTLNRQTLMDEHGKVSESFRIISHRLISFIEIKRFATLFFRSFIRTR